MTSTPESACQLARTEGKRLQRINRDDPERRRALSNAGLMLGPTGLAVKDWVP
jgi:hypothetical protein